MVTKTGNGNPITPWLISRSPDTLVSPPLPSLVPAGLPPGAPLPRDPGLPRTLLSGMLQSLVRVIKPLALGDVLVCLYPEIVRWSSLSPEVSVLRERPRLP